MDDVSLLARSEALPETQPVEGGRPGARHHYRTFEEAMRAYVEQDAGESLGKPEDDRMDDSVPPAVVMGTDFEGRPAGIVDERRDTGDIGEPAAPLPHNGEPLRGLNLAALAEPLTDEMPDDAFNEVYDDLFDFGDDSDDESDDEPDDEPRVNVAQLAARRAAPGDPDDDEFGDVLDLSQLGEQSQDVIVVGTETLTRPSD